MIIIMLTILCISSKAVHWEASKRLSSAAYIEGSIVGSIWWYLNPSKWCGRSGGGAHTSFLIYSIGNILQWHVYAQERD